MDTQNQLAVFSLAVAVGFVGGIVYEPFAFLRLLFGCHRGKNAKIGMGFDVLFWLAFALLSIFSSFALRFPSFRAYIWLGYAVGGIIYLKTLRRIVAFFENLCYNKVAKLVKKAKNQRELHKKEKLKRKEYGKNDYDTRKNEKIDYGDRRSGNDPFRPFARRFDLSMDYDRGVRRPRRKVRRGKRTTSTNNRREKNGRGIL